MLKKRAFKRIINASLSFFVLLLLLLFPQNTNNEEIIYTNNENITIYTLDNNMYVSRTSILNINNEDNIKYIINALTKNTNESKLLSNIFTSLIPENTRLLNYNLDNGLLKLNFSEEFLNDHNNEEKIIESLIYSLCELNNVNKIMIFINGNLLTKLNNGTILPEVLDKNYGINKVYDLKTLNDSISTTTYYIKKDNNDNIYYIPITHITNETNEKIEIIINELKKSNTYNTNLISYLNASYELKDYEILENSINLSFNNSLINNLSNDNIKEIVKYSLALSIRDTYNISDITINFD